MSLEAKVKMARHSKTTHVDLGKKGSFDVNRGALHRALGIPESQKIPRKKLEAALHSSNPHIAHMARSAIGLESMDHSR